MEFVYIATPNHNERPAKLAINALVVHSDEGTESGTTSHIKNPASEVSYHFYIPRHARYVIQFVDPARRAWHAGVSNYLSRVNWNDFSIGVALEHKSGQNYPAAQLALFVQLVSYLAKRYPLERRYAVPHRALRPNEKADPSDMNDAALNALLDQGFSVPTINGSQLVIGVPSGEAGQTATLEQVTKFLRAKASGMSDQDIFQSRELAKFLNIDYSFALAIWWKETNKNNTIGGSDLFKKSRNPGAIKAASGESWPKVEHNKAQFKVFESAQLGLMYLLLHLKQIYGAAGLQHIESIMPVYAPASDGNDPAQYIRSVAETMQIIASM